jgi:toxin ParE1/3/4
VKTKPPRLRPAARADVRAIVVRYRDDSGPGIARAFSDQLQRTLVGVARREPGSPRFAPALDLPGLRAWPVSRFPYLVLGFERPDHFDVLRVLPGKRDIPTALAAETQ